jgi:hypothetical protein
MSGHSHDDHHSNEPKPVAFTVPFILAAVTILAVVLFLSLCDPKPHHAEGTEHEAVATEAASHATDEHKAATEVNAVAVDTLAAESTVPNAGATEHNDAVKAKH